MKRIQTAVIPAVAARAPMPVTAAAMPLTAHRRDGRDRCPSSVDRVVGAVAMSSRTGVWLVTVVVIVVLLSSR